MSTKADKKEWLTREEAAEHLSCSIATIDNYRRKGIIKLHKLKNATLKRFKKSELDELMKPV